MSKSGDIDWLFSGRHFDREIIVQCVHWYVRYKHSLRDLGVRTRRSVIGGNKKALR
ncbi:hypothetical protein FSO04_41500 [Paraburkholderia madseniana]|uniref:IS6 family transposase n=1 Tax=Paraburkholderia madseniana TaxID=2599607 RepID=A0A6N6W158_9BURK|nr:hypothetical protein FSO04_41500 [Paraburkholderia madseniana]